jgi:hypothetical protein
MAAAKPTPAADNSAAVKRDCALLSQFLYENKVHIKLSVTSDKFSKEFDVFQISDAETALEIATFCRTRLGFTVEKAERDRKRALLLNFASQQGLDESGILALLRRDDEKGASPRARACVERASRRAGLCVRVHEAQKCLGFCALLTPPLHSCCQPCPVQAAYGASAATAEALAPCPACTSQRGCSRGRRGVG